MPEKTQKKLLQRIILITSGLFFIGSTGVALITPFLSNSTPSQPTQETNLVEQQLKDREKGYLLVLDREPNNAIALQGLVDTRIEMGNLEGAIEPLEKLIQLYPEDKALQELLVAVKQRAEAEKPKP